MDWVEILVYTKWFEVVIQVYTIPIANGAETQNTTRRVEREIYSPGYTTITTINADNCCSSIVLRSNECPTIACIYIYQCVSVSHDINPGL